MLVKFVKEKETKNTIRFAEVVNDGDPMVIGNLYVQKFAVKELGNPETLEVEIVTA